VPDATVDAWTEARGRHWDLEDDWSDLWVADADGSIVGYVQVDAARLANIWIAPAAQGQGLGKRLLDLAETVIQRRGHKQARLEVFVGNDRAQAFYESRGWAEVGRDTYELAGHPVPGIVMVKDLPQD